MERPQIKPYFVFMKIFILFVVLIYFIWDLFKHFQFSFVIYIYILFFKSKQFKNEENGSNQNQQKSNNMQ